MNFLDNFIKAVLVTSAVGLSIGSASAETMENKVVTKYAQIYNVSLSEAQRRIDLMAKYNSIEKELESMFGDSIAGIYYESVPEFKMIVRTTKKGRTLKNINEVIRDIDLPIEVFSNSPRNSQSIENIIKNQGSRLSRDIKGLQNLAYNPKLDAISVFIYEPNLSLQRTLENDTKLSKISGMPTELIFLDKPFDTSQSIVVGGAPMSQTFGGSNVSKCTAGFTGVNNKGQAGIITAAHCGRKEAPLNTPFAYWGFDQKNWGLDGVKIKATMTSYNPNAQTHDMAFLTLDDPGSATVVNGYSTSDDPNSIEYVDSYAYPAVGTFVCHEGSNTGFSCGRITNVKSTNVTLSGRGCPSMQTKNIPCSPTFAVAETIKEVGSEPLLVASGDSGGPVFSKYPLGIQSAGGNNYMVFSDLRYLSDIGVRLKTY